MEDLLLQIVGRMYPLTIDEKDSELIQKAAESVNEKVMIFKKSYAYRDTQDLLAMCLLQFATENLRLAKDSPSTGTADEEINAKVSEINSLISNFLDKNSVH